MKIFESENLNIKFHGTLEEWNDIYKGNEWNSGQTTFEAYDGKIEI